MNKIMTIVEYRQLGKTYRSQLSINIKEWYSSEYKDDTMSERINEELTFYDLFMCMCFRLHAEETDIYSLLNVSDSLIRERIFGKMSEILNNDYKIVYNLWLYGDNHNSDSKTLTEVYLKLFVIPFEEMSINDIVTLSDEEKYNAAVKEFQRNTKLINLFEPTLQDEENNWFEEYEDNIIFEYLKNIDNYILYLIGKTRKC